MLTGQSLRLRLTVWYAGLLAGTLAAFSVILFLSLSYNLQRHHDDEMVSECNRVLEEVKEEGRCSQLPEADEEPERPGHYVVVRPVENHALPAGKIRPEVVLETRRQDAGEVRVASVIYRPVSGSPACLIEVTDTLGDLESTLGSLRILLLFLVPVVLTAATIGGVVIVRRALRPLEEIVGLTQQVEARKLGLRLDLDEAPREIAGLAATFNQMIERLESSFEQMKRFTADASHELRTPLAVLTNTIEVALQRERSLQGYQDVLQAALSEVHQLTSIVEDLLILSQADAGKLELQFERIPMRDLLRQSVEAIKPRAVARGLTVRALNLEDLHIQGDTRWIRQLVENLLDNAIKFTPAGGSVTVMLQRDGSLVAVEIHDTGIGISANELPRIFARFYRADPARKRDVDGTGLGLSIAQWVASSHGGRIEVESSERHGSTFRVVLPRATVT